MKKGYIFLIGVLVLTLAIVGLYKGIKPADAIKPGLYITEDGLASLLIEDDGTFLLNRHIATDYDPTGNYSVSGDDLVLEVNGDKNETITFGISSGKLIFKSGKLAENLIAVGTPFLYEESKEGEWDYRPMISLGESLYFDTGEVEKELSEKWHEGGKIEEMCSSTEPMKMGETHYIANALSDGTIIYTNDEEINRIYALYEGQFIEYVLQESNE